jgi:hypothetical protein
VARDEHRGRKARTRPGERRRQHELEDPRSRSPRKTAAIAAIHLLLLALFGTASAQDEGVLVPPPITGPPETLTPVDRGRRGGG